MEPIRVLNLFTNMNRGGAETVVMNYYRNIDRSRIQFDFLVHRQKRGVFEDEIESLGGRIYRMPPVSIMRLAEHKKKIRQFFKEHMEYRIVHGHMGETGTFIYEAAKEAGIPVRICHAHLAGMLFDAKTIFRAYLRRRCRNSVTYRFACGKDAGKWLFGKKNDDIVILKNGVETDKFIYNKTVSDCMRAKLGIEGRFVIGHIGSFYPPKRHEFLIDIFYEIHKRDPRSMLVLVGEGALMKKIEDKVRSLGLHNDVIFLGTRSDVEKILQGFDVFLLPSLFEGLPVSLIEAQASGLKCIASSSVSSESNITGNVEYISLNDPATRWAERVLAYKCNYVRTDTSSLIKSSGYDITENAKVLAELYLGYIGMITI